MSHGGGLSGVGLRSHHFWCLFGFIRTWLISRAPGWIFRGKVILRRMLERFLLFEECWMCRILRWSGIGVCLRIGTEMGRREGIGRSFVKVTCRIERQNGRLRSHRVSSLERLSCFCCWLSVAFVSEGTKDVSWSLGSDGHGSGFLEWRLGCWSGLT